MSTTTKLSIEPHGPPGSFAIYLGRDDEHHGLNLATLYDVDPQYKDALFKVITEAYDGAATIARLERESFEWSTKVQELTDEVARLKAEIDRFGGSKLKPIDEAALDPGIRHLVMFLRFHGFYTTDSGDGVSKGEMAEIMVRHVFCQVDPSRLIDEADRLADLLNRWGAPSGNWTIETSYTPGSAALIAVIED